MKTEHNPHPPAALDNWVQEQWDFLEPPVDMIPDSNKALHQVRERLEALKKEASQSLEPKKEQRQTSTPNALPEHEVLPVAIEPPEVSPVAPKKVKWWTHLSFSPSWLRWGLVTSCMVLFSLLPGDLTYRPFEPLETSKGESFELLHARHLERSSDDYTPAAWTPDGTKLSRGDLIQFVYRLSGPYDMMVASLNEKGEFFVYLPFQGERSLRKPKGRGTYPTGRALELDDVLGVERFFFVLHHKSFSAQDIRHRVIAAWKNQGKDLKTLWITWPEGWRVQTQWIRKVQRP